MARATFVLGIWVLAASLGILGYQGLTLYFYHDWPAVSLAFGWQTFFNNFWWPFFGDIGKIHSGYLLDVLSWLGTVPLVLAGVILSYALFLISDSLRGRGGRRSA
jgi:hypothetical protein